MLVETAKSFVIFVRFATAGFLTLMLWFLSTWPLRLNTNESMNHYVNNVIVRILREKINKAALYCFDGGSDLNG